ncbi:hypothetical protein COJ96_05680 [Bacillus sp. AFS073361]|uniref:hypothetical protein n=1 Tax=Bacillus sp. AFS073361 TaxID=2033511 RepID=UPI000BF6A12A|nr:hypothetical protein [Bacillus sp. AFS073361]PFP30204.1 hypothetical protein COJ96_05680 [Bacillus sp. AFS073361]
MKIKKEHLDIPFCSLIVGATNDESPREFIRNSEREFGMSMADIDNMSEEELNGYIEHLDYLWDK